ncbi:MAG: sulfatase-like hydrolase/transferase, partial [Treponema sp.]|nr:sulfatase-like hydrolase/transferase [Treponema sp.]
MKPNIVILMTDQQRADLRKARGYPLDTMPFLDSWAKGGTDFASAYTPNPTCMPARVSMFTGRYPESLRVRSNHNAEDALYTEDLLDLLKKSGYVSALCGKNHSHHKPDDFDFAETTGHLGHEGNRKIQNQREEAFARFMDATNHLEIHSPSPGGLESQHPYQ